MDVRAGEKDRLSVLTRFRDDLTDLGGAERRREEAVVAEWLISQPRPRRPSHDSGAAWPMRLT